MSIICGSVSPLLPFKFSCGSMVNLDVQLPSFTSLLVLFNLNSEL